jgi:5-(aminomethyl)-3-furanmethanol phosphate kinase
MWVVKLGGSLACTDHLRHWLRVLAEAGSLALVPGGGPFADQVRQLQQRCGFGDATAHCMALLAMEQFGHMLCDLQPGLAGAATIGQIHEVLERGETPVWMPSSMVLADPGIEQSWDVTSDSLAVWLGGQLGADKLLLVKSVSLESTGLPVGVMAARNVIDARCGGYLQLSGIQAWVMAGADHRRFAQLRHGEMEGATRIIDTPPISVGE